MKTYKVDIEINGCFVNVGKITGHDFNNAQFSYSNDYLKSDISAPISINLPLKNTKFSAQETKNYFSGLLPEGFIRSSIAQNMHIDSNDYLSILLLLGQECLGAIIIYEDNSLINTASYEKLSSKQIAQLAEEGSTKSISMVQKAHLSLAGASGKVGLYYDKSSNTWYLPKHTAPSTHIVKQSHIRLENIVINELLCLKTAKKLGLNVSSAFIIDTLNDKEKLLFATKRYDRALSKNKINNLYKPYRLHQEDFAQALNISSQDKYESGNSGYFKKMQNLLNTYSSDPIRDIEQLWKITLFNLLIGNTDAHIKNFSLLYSKDLKQIRLAPAYDLISTIIYDESTSNMAFSIGNVQTLYNINIDSIYAEAKQNDINPKIVMHWLEDIKHKFKAALFDSAQEIGYNAHDIAQKIIGKGIYNKISNC